MILQKLEKLDNAKEIFQDYISKRIPFTFRKDLVSLNYEKFYKKVTQNSLLKEIRVEDKTQRKTINFKEFLDSKEFYLNTQYQTVDSKLDIIQNPLLEFLSDFEIRPQIIGNLVPRQYTLWLGFKRDTSSGLHHDFHDNLYTVLEGVKKFRIYSPKEIKKLYVKGKVLKVFENGFISYSSLFARGDGARGEEVLTWKLQELEKLPDSLEKEEEIEKVLEKLLEIEAENGLEFSDFSDNSEEPLVKKIKIEKDDTELNFSRIKDTSNSEIIEKEFPKFRNAKYYDVVLKKGDGLFLPAGWFHEVWSFGDEKDPDGVHMAMNYWMAPPTQNDYDNPYEDGFWEFKFQEFLQELKEFEESERSTDLDR
jgi:hypothetical protein